MDIFKIKNLTFSYPTKDTLALNQIDLDIRRGEFVALMGKSGSGKSTLLRCLKPALAPKGKKSGEIYFSPSEEEPLVSIDETDFRIQSSSIGYVLQNPDSQIVTDRVWHELAFGLENLGIPNHIIKIRVSEMANFFGIQSWFNKDTMELSGGQKQILNLASVMVMKPEVLILDEPTSQLDPIAAADFIQIIKKINREIGTTIIISEHRLDELLPLCDKVVVLEEGKVIAVDTPERTGAILSATNSNMFAAMPAPMQAYDIIYKENIGRQLSCPIDVRGGRLWLNELLQGVKLEHKTVVEKVKDINTEKAMELKDVWFRYSKNEDDVVKGLNLAIRKGEIFAIVGGNGTGKTTTLKILSGILKAYRGKTTVFGKKIEKYSNSELRKGVIGMLPQDPQTLFVEDKVRDDLLETLEGSQHSDAEKIAKLTQVSALTEIEHLMESHPYDISGGEQQRVALAKVLLLEPQIILLDEPTKGIDNFFKSKLGEILKTLRAEGKTIIIVSHDIEFTGHYADRCAMFFEGNVATEGNAKKFFSGNSFYTTSANKMSSHKFKNAITPQDVAELILLNLGKKDKEPEVKNSESLGNSHNHVPKSDSYNLGKSEEPPSANIKVKDEAVAKTNSQETDIKKRDYLNGKLMIVCMYLSLALATIMAFKFGGERSFMFISIMIIVGAIIPFFFVIERKKPDARELVLISVIVALAVAGRAAFFMIPQVKPILAIVIAGSYGLGGRYGFIIGAMSAFMSNFLFGQGPWTPWQMLAMGIIGLVAGIIGNVAGKKTSSSPSREPLITRWILALAGAIGSFIIYGLFVDVWTIFGFQQEISLNSILTVYALALPFNAVLGVSTGVFLFLLGKPTISKIYRIKQKYGLGL